MSCYLDDGSVDIFNVSDLELNQVKEYLRDTLSLGKVSIHTKYFKNETVTLIEIFSNDGWRNYLRAKCQSKMHNPLSVIVSILRKIKYHIQVLILIQEKKVK